jgi:hypothetical protein
MVGVGINVISSAEWRRPPLDSINQSSHHPQQHEHLIDLWILNWSKRG